MRKPGPKIALSVLLLSALILTACAEQTKKPTNAVGSGKSQQQGKSVTFIELGSVNCIPCRMMQPVMKEIEEEYAGRVNVVFYDVWTKEGEPYAEQYKIRAIPTQVFLDENGKEFFRHEGFFPKEEIAKLLREYGIR